MRRRRSPPWLRVLRTLRERAQENAAESLTALQDHPARAGILALTGVLLLWLVVTRSLPYALAETAPELALWLDPNQPVALLVMANKARANLLDLTDANPAGSAPAVDQTASIEAVSTAPPAPDQREIAAKREMLRGEIYSLSTRLIAADPLNARAYRLLAEISGDPAQVRALMQEAFKRSRREFLAVFWLMNDSFERRDYADVIQKADILMRTREQLGRYVMSYLAEVAAAPEGRQLLVSVLTKNPKWRGVFFRTLPAHARRPDTPFDIMLALKEAGNPPPMEEFGPYLNVLVEKKIVDLAYNAWLQLMPKEKLTSLGLLNNAGFASDPSGLPFDWSVVRGQNTVVDFVAQRDGGDEGQRALRFGFGAGRVKFPEVSQVVMLPPGRYRLEGAFQGSMAARRGLRWEIRCLGAKTVLAETDMIFGHPRNWQDFGLDIAVPQREDCKAQHLRLYHHARSPSEEMITGEIYFRSLRLARVEPKS